MNKKGAIEELQALIVPLIAIAIILTVGFLIFAEAKTKIVSITGVSTTFTNESIASFTTGTYAHLTHSGNCMAFSCSQVINQTGETIATTMYNCTFGSGIVIRNGSELITTAINVTYACTNMTLAYNATSDVQNATSDIPGWLPIIVITIIGAILIGLVARFRGR